MSTQNLKCLVSCGNVSELDALLSQPYFIKGLVSHAKHNGTELGFPTANIAIDHNRLPLCDGIYATFTHIDGKTYPSMTNVGSKPTFNDDTPSIETYIFDFDADLYGKEIQIDFIERTRDIRKFANTQELQNRLQLDEREIREILKNRRDV